MLVVYSEWIMIVSFLGNLDNGKICRQIVIQKDTCRWRNAQGFDDDDDDW